MNTKGQSTDTPILLTIVVFQAFVLICLGFLDVTATTVVADTHLGFSQTVISNLAVLGWGNLLVFTPMLVCIVYIIAKFIRGI